MKPGDKFDFVLRSDDKHILIEKKNIGLEEGALLFFKDLKYKMGLKIRITKDKPEKEVYSIEGEY